MAAWIGPAIVAAVISALVTGIGWFVSERQAVRREAGRRRERVVDMQTALLAEIRAQAFRLDDLRSTSASLMEAMRADPTYTPFIPHEVESMIFRSLVGELHLLPTFVIDPVVLYYQQVAAVAGLVADMAGERYGALDWERKLTIYKDYTALLMYKAVLGRMAVEAIRRSLNIRPDAVASDPLSEVARDGVSELSPSDASRSPDMFKPRKDSGEPRA